MRTALLALLLVVAAPALGQPTIVMNPNEVQLGPYRHKELPALLLARIRSVTDTFYPVDGLTYEQSVDLYRRDADPESNLVLYEEMSRAYRTFCVARCNSDGERKEVYKLLLLRTMFPSDESVARAQANILTSSEAASVVSLYRLPPKPISVYSAP